MILAKVSMARGILLRSLVRIQTTNRKLRGSRGAGAGRLAHPNRRRGVDEFQEWMGSELDLGRHSTEVAAARGPALRRPLRQATAGEAPERALPLLPVEGGPAVRIHASTCKKCGHPENRLEWRGTANEPMDAGHLEAICNNCGYRWVVKALDEQEPTE